MVVVVVVVVVAPDRLHVNHVVRRTVHRINEGQSAHAARSGADTFHVVDCTQAVGRTADRDELGFGRGGGGRRVSLGSAWESTKILKLVVKLVVKLASKTS